VAYSPENTVVLLKSAGDIILPSTTAPDRQMSGKFGQSREL